MTVTQTQKADAIVPAAFRLPLDVAVKTVGGTENKSVDIRQRIEKITMKLPAKPKSVEFDPSGKVLAMNVQVLPVTVVK